LQHLYLDGRYFGVEPGPIDPVLLAGGMGLPGRLVTDLEQFELLAKERGAGKPEGPFVIHVRVPEHLEAPPPVAPWLDVISGASTTRPIY
jgi:acetolactate synthase I/II/III large subunit